MTLRKLLAEIARGMDGARGRAGQPGERLALPDPRRVPAVPRAPVPREAAALLARRDGDPGDHRLPPAGDPRRHRGRARRRRVHARSSRRSRTAAGSTSSATARRRAGRRSTPRHASFLDDLGLRSLEELPPLEEIAKTLALEPDPRRPRKPLSVPRTANRSSRPPPPAPTADPRGRAAAEAARRRRARLAPGNRRLDRGRARHARRAASPSSATGRCSPTPSPWMENP